MCVPFWYFWAWFCVYSSRKWEPLPSIGQCWPFACLCRACIRFERWMRPLRMPRSQWCQRPWSTQYSRVHWGCVRYTTYTTFKVNKCKWFRFQALLSSGARLHLWHPGKSFAFRYWKDKKNALGYLQWGSATNLVQTNTQSIRKVYARPQGAEQNSCKK